MLYFPFFTNDHQLLCAVIAADRNPVLFFVAADLKKPLTEYTHHCCVYKCWKGHRQTSIVRPL